MSVRIDISNYEVYVMDFLDGTLSSEMNSEFEAFLLKHPDVAIELDEISNPDLKVEVPTFNIEKDAMHIKIKSHREINESNYEEAFAFSLDADVNPELTNSVREFVKLNPMLEKDWKTYSATKLTPKLEQIYTEKRGLKKPLPLWEVARPIGIRVAAGLVIILGIATLFRNLQSEVYNPRLEAPSFSSLEVPEPSRNENKSISERAILAAAPTNINKSDRIEPMPIASSIQSWNTPSIENRDDEVTMLAHMPSYASTEISDFKKQGGSALNLTQYIGKELLGVDPKNAVSTKALLKEGALKVIDKNEQIAFHSDADSEDRKSFSIMAGVFEFKRVTYKSN